MFESLPLRQNCPVSLIFVGIFPPVPLNAPQKLSRLRTHGCEKHPAKQAHFC